MKILNTRLAHDGWLKLVIAAVRMRDGQTVEREFIAPRPSACVLPYDPDRRVALLVRQTRPAVIHAGGAPWMLEAAAGLLDPGETAEDAARREAMEELGVRLGEMRHLADTWPSPGPSSERMSLFLAPYRACDRIGPGGGAPGEHEDLEVVELTLKDLSSQASAGGLHDLKTLTLVLALYRETPGFFD